MRHFRRLFVIAVVALLSPVLTGLYCQTVADAARKAKENKDQLNTEKTASAATTPGKRRVYTNEDLPGSKSPTMGEDASPDHIPNQPLAPTPTTAQQWATLIRGQKAAVDSLQKETDNLEKSIHYVEANRYSNGPEYNAYQKKKQDRVEIMKHRLASQQEKLADLKDRARKAGFGSSVYDQ